MRPQVTRIRSKNYCRQWGKYDLYDLYLELAHFLYDSWLDRLILSGIQAFHDHSIGDVASCKSQVPWDDQQPRGSRSSRRSFPRWWHRYCKSLSSVTDRVRSNYMTKEAQVLPPHNWGQRQLLGSPRDFLICDKIIPFNVIDPSQAPLIQSIYLPLLGDRKGPRFTAI